MKQKPWIQCGHQAFEREYLMLAKLKKGVKHTQTPIITKAATRIFFFWRNKLAAERKRIAVGVPTFWANTSK